MSHRGYPRTKAIREERRSDAEKRNAEYRALPIEERRRRNPKKEIRQ